MNEKDFEILSISEKTETDHERFVVLYSKDGKTVLKGWVQEESR